MSSKLLWGVQQPKCRLKVEVESIKYLFETSDTLH